MSRERENTERQVEKLAERADDVGIERLQPHERFAVIAHSVRGITGNGGLRYFFQGELPLSAAVEAYEAIGLHDVATAARASAKIFPNEKMADDPDARQDHLKNVDLEPHNKVFDKLSWDALYDAIGAYWKERAKTGQT